jgi:hypothetical protein
LLAALAEQLEEHAFELLFPSQLQDSEACVDQRFPDGVAHVARYGDAQGGDARACLGGL